MSVQAARKTEVDALIEHLLACADAENRKQYIAANRAANWVDVVARLTERVWQEVRVDTVEAQRIADIAIETAEATADKISLAKSLRAKANALYALDHHAAAIQLHEQAITLFEQTDDHAELARAIFKEQGNARRLARLEINIGNVYHRQDRFAEALEVYERAYHELIQHDDPEGVAAALSNLSLCCISLNDFPKALDLHRKARQHCEQKGMPILVACADYNIAYLYFLRGELGRAIQMLRDAAVSAKKADDTYQQALCNLDL